MDSYLLSLIANHQSKDTLRLRRWQLAWLARELEDRDPWAVTVEDLERVLAVEEWAIETRRSRVSAVRGFYRWAKRTGRIDLDPAALLAPVKQSTPLPRPCPERVLHASLSAVDRRVRLMMLLGAYGGLRASETAQVHSRDLDDDGWLTVHGKGGKDRLVPVVNIELLEAIREARGWLFPGRIEGHLSAGYVTRLVSRALADDWTAHTLRHRFGTIANARTHDLAAVQELLGHASPVTTRIYVKVPGDDLIAAVRAAA